MLQKDLLGEVICGAWLASPKPSPRERALKKSKLGILLIQKIMIKIKAILLIQKIMVKNHVKKNAEPLYKQPRININY